MSSHKAFDGDRIAQCLAILDAWRASAQPLKAFAQQHHYSYNQLRAWLRHEPRWTGVAAPKTAVVTVPSNCGAFQRLHLTAPQASHQPSAAQGLRIECASAGSDRTARVHFPLSDAQLSAQWLATFLGA